MRELLILRHAKSAHARHPLGDYDRPLAKRGQRDAPRVGRWLVAVGLVPDRIVSSTARRAAETTRLLVAALGSPAPAVTWSRAIYLADAGAVAEVAGKALASCRRLLLVGHNPGLEDLVRRLAGDVPQPADGKLLPTAAVAHLRIGAGPLPSGVPPAELVRIVRPGEMPS